MSDSVSGNHHRKCGAGCREEGSNHKTGLKKAASAAAKTERELTPAERAGQRKK
jgi:hypothetical protein